MPLISAVVVISAVNGSSHSSEVPSAWHDTFNVKLLTEAGSAAGLCRAPGSPLGAHQAASGPARSRRAAIRTVGKELIQPGEERILRAPGEELTGKFTVKWFQMTLLRLCHILDAWRNFIRLDIFLTSGRNFKTLVGGNELYLSFFGSWERSWKMGAWMGWGVLPSNSSQIARLQRSMQHLF